MLHNGFVPSGSRSCGWTLAINLTINPHLFFEISALLRTMMLILTIRSCHPQDLDMFAFSFRILFAKKPV